MSPALPHRTLGDAAPPLISGMGGFGLRQTVQPCGGGQGALGLLLRGVSQTEEDKDCPISLTCGIGEKLIETDSRMVVTREGAGYRAGQWGDAARDRTVGGMRSGVQASAPLQPTRPYRVLETR